MSYLPPIYYINLEHRKDRLVNVHKQMSIVEAPVNNVYRINATLHSDGATGCAASHIEALHTALHADHSSDCVCIIEDDFGWTDHGDNIKSFLEPALKSDNWDVLLLSYGFWDGELGPPTTEGLRRVVNAASTAGYIIKKRYIPKLLNHWELGYAKRLQYNVVKGHPYYHELAIDQHWKKLQREDRWFTTLKKLGQQVPSYSDIEKTDKGYGG